MATINEDYVSYETAQLLKEKGFDAESPAMLYKKHDNADGTSEIWTACTLQIAMKWLREKHVVIVVTPKSFFADGCCASWAYSIWADDNSEVDGEEEWKELYESYEQAVEAALKYSLKNLVLL